MADVKHNETITTPGGCQPDDYRSRANNGGCNCQSLLQANAQARLREREACTEWNTGKPGASQWNWNPADMRIRERYTKNVVTAGNATHERSEDDIY